MTDIAICVENLSKLYRIGGKQERYKTLRENLVTAVTAPFHRFRSARQDELDKPNRPDKRDRPHKLDRADYIWALKDVSFEIKQGEVVGIIGRNGAGKTTLLKILSRITEPTEGYADIYGRVGSLLEVGTGFHPELTGRENIYLNGAVLGMKRVEIDKKFDEIVDFAEVEKFIDTPVKHYSTGMYLRLAFGVAAHLEPEILLVDEVLAVGDAAFQKKCLGKMGDVAKEGRTVLFVSHNLQAIQRLCKDVYLFDNGHVATRGSPVPVINSYLAGGSVTFPTDLESQLKDSNICLKSISVTQDGCETNGFLDTRRPFELHIKYQLFERLTNLLMGFDFCSADSTQIFRTFDMLRSGLDKRGPGEYRSICQFPGEVFQPGTYNLQILIGIHRVRWISKEKIIIKLTFDGPKTSDVSFPGIISPQGNWTVVKENNNS
jgi:lipopolysaccharide transport system ATP-binding protein